MLFCSIYLYFLATILFWIRNNAQKSANIVAYYLRNARVFNLARDLSNEFFKSARADLAQLNYECKNLQTHFSDENWREVQSLIKKRKDESVIYKEYPERTTTPEYYLLPDTIRGEQRLIPNKDAYYPRVKKPVSETKPPNPEKRPHKPNIMPGAWYLANTVGPPMLWRCLVVAPLWAIRALIVSCAVVPVALLVFVLPAPAILTVLFWMPVLVVVVSPGWVVPVAGSIMW